MNMARYFTNWTNMGQYGIREVPLASLESNRISVKAICKDFGRKIGGWRTSGFHTRSITLFDLHQWCWLIDTTWTARLVRKLHDSLFKRKINHRIGKNTFIELKSYSYIENGGILKYYYTIFNDFFYHHSNI